MLERFFNQHDVDYYSHSIHMRDLTVNRQNHQCVVYPTEYRNLVTNLLW